MRSLSCSDSFRLHAEGSRHGPHVSRQTAVVAAVLLCVTALGTGAAVAAQADMAAPEDPLESLNRHAYASSRAFDRRVLRPVAMGYARIVPRVIRRAIRNVRSNLGEPAVFINDVLQLRIRRAAHTAGRFATNSTLGLGGLFDPATKAGLPHDGNDFGLTMARYGFTPGPYLYLPLLGPTTLRDALGKGVDRVINPLGQVSFDHRSEVFAGLGVGSGLDRRAGADKDIERVDEMGTDPYVTTRSVYLQARQAKVSGKVSIDTLPLLDDPASAPAPAPSAAAAGLRPVEPASPAPPR